MLPQAQSQAHARKVSTSLIVFAACVLGVGIGIFGLNFWHTSQCATEKSAVEIDEMLDALSRRILQMESQVQKNEILVSKVINSLQKSLLKIETKEYEEISASAKDEAVRVALYLAGHPAPPMPVFPMEEEYLDAEKLADVIDDVYGKSETETKEDFLGQESEEEVEVLAVTDAEAEELCTEWRTKYHVVTGASWGELPFEMQQRWLAYSCDYHLKDEGESPEQEND